MLDVPLPLLTKVLKEAEGHIPVCCCASPRTIPQHLPSLGRNDDLRGEDC